jgi:integrase
VALSDVRVRSAKPKARPYKLGDGGGLWIYVTPKGRRLWHFRFRRPDSHIDTTMSFGPYPEVSLSQAREKAIDARRLLIAGKNPVHVKEAERANETNTFAAIAEEWLGRQQLAGVTRTKAEWLFSLVSKDLGARPIATIEPPEVLQALRKIESKGHHETAARVRQRIGQVFRYAIATDRAKHDPTGALRGALKAPEITHHASLTDPKKVGALLRAIDGFDGHPATLAALKLAALTFVRPGELRAAEWSEFDLPNAEWRIPASRMKMSEQHIVPLSTQALTILRELHAYTGDGKYLFPSMRTRERCMSNNTVNAALRRLGYSSEEQTGHGFRSMASTLLNEQGFPPDVIELQLAHAERNKVRAAYNKAQRLTERRKMMQAWADYLDGLRQGGNVVSLKRPA